VVSEPEPLIRLTIQLLGSSFAAWFPDEKSCVGLFWSGWRWPAGFAAQDARAIRAGGLDDGFWACSGCARKVSVTAGTIFDRSRIPLADWFTAIWFMTNQKYGISALGLQRLLGLGSYQTAWTMLRKLRSAIGASGAREAQRCGRGG